MAKIAVTASGRTPSVPMDSRFGRSPFFIIYDLESNAWKCLENNSINSSSGAGIATAQMLAQEGVNAVITGEVGPNAMQALKAADIDVLYMSSGTVEQAIQRYKSGALEKPSSAIPSSKQSAAQVSSKTARLAVATDGDEVSQHFGHCSQYTLVDIVDGHIKNKAVIANPGHQPGFLPRYLADKGVNYIIAGGMGTQAQSLFKEMGVEPILGVSGNIDEVIDAFINGTLQSGESLCEH